MLGLLGMSTEVLAGRNSATTFDIGNHFEHMRIPVALRQIIRSAMRLANSACYRDPATKPRITSSCKGAWDRRERRWSVVSSFGFVSSCHHEESGLDQIVTETRAARDGLSDNGRRGRGVGARRAHLFAERREWDLESVQTSLSGGGSMIGLGAKRIKPAGGYINKLPINRDAAD